MNVTSFMQLRMLMKGAYEWEVLSLPNYLFDFTPGSTLFLGLPALELATSGITSPMLQQGFKIPDVASSSAGKPKNSVLPGVKSKR